MTAPNTIATCEIARCRSFLWSAAHEDRGPYYVGLPEDPTLRVFDRIEPSKAAYALCLDYLQRCDSLSSREASVVVHSSANVVSALWEIWRPLFDRPSRGDSPYDRFFFEALDIFELLASLF